MPLISFMAEERVQRVSEGISETRGQARETQEERERREEKEQVLTVLHAWYDQKNFNTPAHRGLAEATERIQGIFEQLMPYIEQIYREIGVTDFSLKKGFKGFFIEGKQRGRETEDSETHVIKFLERWSTDFKDDHLFRELLETFKREIKEVGGLNNQLEEQSKRIFLETAMVVGLGPLLSLPGEYSFRRLIGDATPYRLHSFIWKSLPPDTRYQGMYLGDWLRDDDIEAFIRIVKEKLGITDEEIKQTEKIMFSPEEREKIERLKRALRVWREGLPSVIPQEGSFMGRFSKNEYEVTLAMMTASKAREYYDLLRLPVVHRERALTDLKFSGEILV